MTMPMTFEPCLFCGGDRLAPDHRQHCDGRQGTVEAKIESPTTPTSRSVDRYRRILAVYQATSAEAWVSIQQSLPQIDGRIVGAILARGGATSAEIEDATGLKHQTVSAQIRHMAEAGILHDTGERRLTHSQRRAIVWHLVACLRP
jgi:hypothetical protein